MKQLPWYGLVFLCGLVVGRLVLPASSEWELHLVRKDALDRPAIEQAAGDQAAIVPSREMATTRAGATPEPREPALAPETEIATLPTPKSSSDMGSRAGVAFEDPDQPPAFAPPPHLIESEFESLFELQDQLDERVLTLETMIADMESDGLPEDHIAFMREALLAEEGIDDGSFDALFDEPEPTYEEREADIIESYGEAGASPEEVEEMLEVLREGFESAESPAADWDLHNPPAPLD